MLILCCSAQVRISVYVMTLFAILLDVLGDKQLQGWIRKRVFKEQINETRLRNDYKALHDSFRNTLGISGFTMVMTAIVQSALKQLSLFHAICLMFFILLIFVPFFFGCLRHPSERVTMALYVVASLACEGWMLYFVLNADTFGGTCNAEVWAATAQYNGRGINRGGLMGVTIALMVFSVITLLYVAFPRVKIAEKMWEKHRAFRTAIDRAIMLLIFAFWAYFVVWTESIITKSKSRVTAGEADWTFGQMLAIATLLGPVFEFCSLVYKWHREDDAAVEPGVQGGLPEDEGEVKQLHLTTGGSDSGEKYRVEQCPV